MNNTIPVTLSLPAADLQRLDQIACRSTRGNRSAIVRRWIRAFCPVCDGPTRPDPDRPGCRFCDACGEPTIFAPETA